MATAVTKPHWDCRWPDPVAMQVASERILATLSTSQQTDLNRRLPVLVRLLNSLDSQDAIQALLITPWAAERIFWNRPGQTEPPIRSAFPLEGDEAGRVTKGQGVLLALQQEIRPVLIAWEPETGHFFVENLLRPVLEFTDPEALIAAAIRIIRPQSGISPNSDNMAHILRKPVSRRRLFRWFNE